VLLEAGEGMQGGPVAWAGLNEQWEFPIIQKNSNEFELIRSKDWLPVLENFEIKYWIEGFEESNNFIHRISGVLNENSENLSGLYFIEFGRIFFRTSNLDESWTKRLTFAPTDQLNSWRRVWSSI
jgi:hypothetical protein